MSSLKVYFLPILRSLLFLGLLLLFCAAGSANAENQEYLSVRIKAYETESNYAAILAEGVTLTKSEPKNPLGWYLKGWGLAQLTNLDDAMVALKIAADLAPTEAKIWGWLGKVARLNHQLDDAIMYYEKSISINPKYLDGYVLLIEALDYSNQTSRSKLAKLKLKRLNPVVAEKVEVLFGFGDSVLPDDVFQKLFLTENPTGSINPKPLPDILKWLEISNQGIAQFKSGNLDQAIPLLKTASEGLRKTVGRYHPDALRTSDYLALAYVEDLKIADALNNFSSSRKFESLVKLAEESAKEKSAAFGTESNQAIRADLALAYFRDLNGDSFAGLIAAESVKKRANEKYGANSETALWANIVITGALAKDGQVESAIALATETHDIALKKLSRTHPVVAFSFGTMCQTYLLANQYENAYQAYEKAIPAYKEILGENHRNYLYLTTGSIITQIAMGRIAEANKRFDYVTHLYEKVFSPDDTERKTLDLIHAVLLSPLKQTATANKELTDLLNWSVRNKPIDDPFLISVAPIAAQVMTAGHQGDATRLLKFFVNANEKSLVDVQVIPGEIGKKLSDRALFYKIYALLMLNRDVIESFHFAELSKSRSLLESLSYSTSKYAGILSEGERKVLDRLEQLLTNAENAKSDAFSNTDLRIYYESERANIAKQLFHYRSELELKYPKFKQVSHSTFTTPETLIKSLEDDDLFINYFYIQTHIAAHAISPSNGLLPTAPQDASSIIKLIGSLRKGFETGNLGTEYQADAKQLSKLLLEPLAKVLKGKKKLIISADGPLALIPFELLEFNGKPLAEQFEIVYTPSASIYVLTKQRAAEYKMLSRKPLLGVGGAEYEATPSKAEGAARGQRKAAASGLGGTLSSFFGIGKKEDKAAIALRSYRNKQQSNQAVGQTLRAMRGDWENLPGTQAEVESVAGIFGKQSALLLGKDASEQKLQDINRTGELGSYQYVLFSTHGYIDPAEPSLNSIVLSQLNNPPNLDGYITAREWVGYDMKSDLTVMSGCETAVGEVVQGEGILGLPFALFLAGNNNLLLTLWSVDDKATQLFVGKFFQKVKDGLDYSAALAKTKREFMADPKYSDPFYWAPFVLYGI